MKNKQPSMPKHTPSRGKRRVKAWAIVNGQGDLTNKQTEHFQHYIFKEKKPADYLAWIWNRQVGSKKYKVIPCTITYSLPSTKTNKGKR